MRNFILFIIFVLFGISVNSQAESIKIKATKEIICECIGTYTRFSFEIENSLLVNVKVVDGSSSDTCDKWHMQSLISSATAKHPDGVIGIGVAGYTVKDKNMNLDYEQCLGLDEIEMDSYWFVEEIFINLDKINKK